MDEKPPFQYSLRTLFAVTTGVAIVTSLSVTFGASFFVWFITLSISSLVGWLGCGCPRKREHAPWTWCVWVFILITTACIFRDTLVQFTPTEWTITRPKPDSVIFVSSLAMVVGGAVRRWARLLRAERLFVVVVLACPTSVTALPLAQTAKVAGV
jgi:hypothetical protein